MTNIYRITNMLAGMILIITASNQAEVRSIAMMTYQSTGINSSSNYSAEGRFGEEFDTNSSLLQIRYRSWEPANTSNINGQTNNWSSNTTTSGKLSFSNFLKTF